MITGRRQARLVVGVVGMMVAAMLNIPDVGAQPDEVESARQRVAEIQAQQKELARSLEETWVAQVQTEERLAATEDALKRAESDLWLARSSLEQWAVRLYMDLTTGKSMSLLMVDGPEGFEAGVGYLEAVGGDEKEILNRYRIVTNELARQQTDHRSQLARLEEIRGEQEELFAQLIEKLAAAQQDLEFLESLDLAPLEPASTTQPPTTTSTTPTTTTTQPPTTTTTQPPTTTTTTPNHQPPPTTTQPPTTQPPQRPNHQPQPPQRPSHQPPQPQPPTTTTRPPTTTTSTPTTTTTRPPDDGYDYQGVCPVDQPNTFVDTWGAPRSGGRTHKGVDLLAARGTPVRAIYEGVLFRVDEGGLGGLYIWLRSPWGDEYYYAHLNEFGRGVVTGKQVSQGDLIGYVGTSGNSPDYIPHLHFEYHPGGGSAVNPHQLAVQACE